MLFSFKYESDDEEDDDGGGGVGETRSGLFELVGWKEYRVNKFFTTVFCVGLNIFQCFCQKSTVVPFFADVHYDDDASATMLQLQSPDDALNIMWRSAHD